MSIPSTSLRAGRTGLAAILGVAVWAAPAAAQIGADPAAQPRAEQHGAARARAANKDVQISASSSRTAVWIGEPLELVIEATCAPNIDVLDADLEQDKLKLEGLEVLAASSERTPTEGGGTLRRFRYQLAAYQVGAPTLTIGPQTIRYYVRRPGEPPEHATPQGELLVPVIAIARRSTLPDDVPGLNLRDEGAMAGVPRWLQNAWPLGIGLVVLAAAPLVMWIVAAARSGRARVKRPSARAVRSRGRTALDELKALDATSETARLDAYTRLDHALRQHVAEARSIPAHALSASEIATKLGDTPSAAVTGELLAECERARYAPLDRLPPAERFRAAVERAEAVLGAS